MDFVKDAASINRTAGFFISPRLLFRKPIYHEFYGKIREFKKIESLKTIWILQIYHGFYENNEEFSVCIP